MTRWSGKKDFRLKSFKLKSKAARAAKAAKGTVAAKATVAATAAKNDLIQFFPAQPAATSRKKAKAKTVGGSQNVRFSL